MAPMADAGFVTLAAMVFLLVVAGGLMTGYTLKREVVRAMHRKEPLPRIAGWWYGVRRRAPALLAAAVALLLGGSALLGSDLDRAGRILVLGASGLAGYVVHAILVARAMERAAREASG